MLCPVSYTHLDVYKRQIQTSESNVNESKIMNEVAIHSTPISIDQNKKSDDGNMLTRLYNMMYNSLEKQDSMYLSLIHI